MINHVGVNTRKFLIIIITVLAVASVSLSRTAGAYLVLDNPERTDAVVVLAGDRNDCRYYRALQVLNHDSPPLLFVDSNTDEVQFGRPLATQQEEFIRRTTGTLIDRVRVCPIQGDSTEGETEYVQRCLADHGFKSVLLVTSDFHTRRALSIFRRRLPRYRWSAAAAHDQNRFGEKWWRQREWAKTTLLEWAKLIWWEMVDRWRSPPNADTSRSRMSVSPVVSRYAARCILSTYTVLPLAFSHIISCSPNVL
jgi:DUF218 domain